VRKLFLGLFFISGLFFYLARMAVADGPIVQWEKAYGGIEEEKGFSTQQTSDGGYIITGHTGPASPLEDSDVYLIKTNEYGNKVWEKTFGGSASEVSRCVQQTSDGGYILTGTTYSFSGGDLMDPDIYLIKTDQFGNKQWEKNLGGGGREAGYCVRQTSDGGYVIVGYNEPVGKGPYNICLLKTDASGTMQWQKAFGGTGWDYGRSVQETSDEGFIIGGSKQVNNNSDAYLVKTDSSGNKEWERTYGGTESDGINSVQQTPDGGFVFGGTTHSYTPQGSIYLVKTNADGNKQWERVFGGPTWYYGYSVDVTQDGGFVVTGPCGYQDVYVVKTDAHGNKEWDKTIGGANREGGESIQQTSDLGYIIVGKIKYDDSGDVDVYAVKLAPEDTGILNGTVFDGTTWQPIENSGVFVSDLPHLVARSDESGHYEITGVPFDTLFVLEATHSNYYKGQSFGVQVTGENPTQTVDIQLTPAQSDSFHLDELNPNPNSDPMEIMAGGTGYRYYQVVDDANIVRPGINVATDPPLNGPFLSSGTKGVVSIDVNSLEVNDGQTITVTHLADLPLDPTDQKSFVVNIVPLKQAKNWKLIIDAELGISNGILETEKGLLIILEDDQESDGVPEEILCSREASFGLGLSGSKKIAAGAGVYEVKYAGWAGGEVAGSLGPIVRDKYAHAYDTDDIIANIAKLDLLLYPTTMLSPELMIIQQLIDATLLPIYREELEAGCYIKGTGRIGADLVVGPAFPSATIGGGVKSGVYGEGFGSGCLILHKDGKISRVLEGSLNIYAQIQGGVGGIALGPALTHSLLPIGRHTIFLGNYRYELVFSGSVLEEIKVTLGWGTEHGYFSYERNTEQIEWCFKGLNVDLLELIKPGGILDALCGSLEVTEALMVDLTSGSVLTELNKILEDAQNNSGVVITYERKSLLSEVIDVPVFEFEIGAGVVIEADINCGLEGSISETREMVVQRGKLVGLYHYPTESYSEVIYTPININLADVYAKALIDVGEPILQAIFDSVEEIAQAGQEVVLNTCNSVLQIDPNVLPAGQEIVNIFEAALCEQEMQMMMSAMADSNDSNEISYFGIGGTYQLQPADLNLPSPATFAITYSDEEIADHNELLLRMYRWADANGRWEYIGGAVDDFNNTVTASIDRFGTYTLGAQVEYGDFTFQADPNTVTADGNSVVTFSSEQITNNDGTTVADDTLFTIAVSGGTIITPDANTVIDGNQVTTQAGILQFDLQAPQIGMEVTAEATSLNRLATVAGAVAFTDFNSPAAPNRLQVEIVECKILVSWNANSDIDLAGYKIYFDDDSNGPPYDGVAYYSGQNSPVDVAGATSHFLRGLQSEHTYYVTVAAYDMSGNESSYSNEVVLFNALPPDSDSDGMPDAWEIEYSLAANGLDPTANDAMADNDGDALTNFLEYLNDTVPTDPDTDDDGFLDGPDNCKLMYNPSQADVDGDGDGDTCEADISGNHEVNFFDFALLASRWLDSSCGDCGGADLNGEQDVDFADLDILADSWLAGTTP